LDVIPDLVSIVMATGGGERARTSMRTKESASTALKN
jgi:hypothetical protein